MTMLNSSKVVVSYRRQLRFYDTTTHRVLAMFAMDGIVKSLDALSSDHVVVLVDTPTTVLTVFALESIESLSQAELLRLDAFGRDTQASKSSFFAQPSTKSASSGQINFVTYPYPFYFRRLCTALTFRVNFRGVK